MTSVRQDRSLGDPSPEAYSSSISAAYFWAMERRLSFIVGVSSSPPGSQNTGSTRRRLICSTRDNFALAAATPAVISSTSLEYGMFELDESASSTINAVL